jgi:chromosome segregation ATPase
MAFSLVNYRRWKRRAAICALTNTTAWGILLGEHFTTSGRPLHEPVGALMPLFKGRSSLLEVQNRALIKTAKARAERIDELERELQIAASQIGQLQREEAHERTSKVERDLQTAQQRIGTVERDLQIADERTNKLERELQQARSEIERLTLERDFYSKTVAALQEENRELTESATKYSLHAQKLERELIEVATQYSQRAQKVDSELTETATKYSLWGQKLERELNRIDPDGAPSRRFEE